MITVRATRDFHAGPRQANGSRDVAIPRGSTREICDPGEAGAFYTLTKWGTVFGLCRLGQGWEVVRRDPPKRSESARIPYVDTPQRQTRRDESPTLTDAVTVGGLAWAAEAFDSAASDELEGTSRAGEDGELLGDGESSGEDDWPL